MSIVSDADILTFLGITEEYFVVNAASDSLILKYDGGIATTIDVAADGTYDGTQLATAVQSAINTAFTISCTVAWSSTTRKFIFTVPAGGHTFAYTHVGSEAGGLFGFDQDHAAAASITSDNAAGDPSAIALSIRDAVEDYVEKYCRRTFASTTYTLEKYNGTGTKYLALKNYPILEIHLLSIGIYDAIKIYNTNKNTYASVSITSTGVTLNRDGSTDSTITFSSQATLSAMVIAINAVGNGWIAELCSSEYASYKSSFLIKKMGLSTIDSDFVSLVIPSRSLDDFEVYENRGIIYSPTGFPRGINNINVTYTAGYTSYSDDLTYAIKILTKQNYEKYNNQTYGLDSYRIGDVSYNFSVASALKQDLVDSAIPVEVRDILGKYRKGLV
jgi:hypothetical protein